MFLHISLRWIFFYILFFALNSADATAIPGDSSTTSKVASRFAASSENEESTASFGEATPAAPQEARQTYLAEPPAKKLTTLFKQTISSNASAAKIIRIMPLGDSNTEGVRSDFVAGEDRIAYRDKLEEFLDGSKLKGLYDFVGSESTGSAHMNDTNHAGFGGARDEDIAELLEKGEYSHYGEYMRGPGLQPDYKGYLDIYGPDIILLHIGTNWIDGSENSIYDVEKIRNQVDLYEKRVNKDVTVILAKIILTDGSNPAIDAATKAYNQNVSAMVQKRVEEQGDRFEVERMQEGQAFKTIGTVAGAGNSSRLLRYTYHDAGAPAGQLYYRLKQIDDDGTFSYSNVIAINLPFATELSAKVYPNPTDGTGAICLSATGFVQAAAVEITLRGAMGRKLYHRTVTAGTQGELITAVQFPAGLSEGLYICELSSLGKSRKLKLLVR